MGFSTICLCAIATLAILGPDAGLGQNLNLTGTLNVNDTPVVNTTNLLLSMLVSLAESIIPIIVGAAIGHKSIRFWQEKKDQIATKNNMLANYVQSFRMHGQVLDSFVNRVFRSYVIFGEGEGGQAPPLSEFSNAEDRVNGFLRFPSDPGELPSRKFSEEYRKLDDRMGEISQARERLYLDLKHFSKDGDAMIEKLQNVKGLLKRLEILLDKMIKSGDGKDFMSCYNNYRALGGKIKTETERAELDLVRLVTSKPFAP